MRYQSLLILLAVAVPAAAQTPPKLRLPEGVRPTRYQAELTLAPTAETFSAVIDIDLELRAATALVWLNGADLTVDEAWLETGGRRLSARPVAGGTDFVGFQLEAEAGPGAARLHAAYQGKLYSKDSDGLFRLKDGGDWYLFTQFEPTDARRAFPCFDEPGFKTPWQITVRAPKGLVVLSNAPAAATADGPDGLQVVRFAETRPLPSYLVALAVGPFDLVDAGRAGRKRTPIRIVVPRGRAAEARYAAQVTGEILTRLENYFDSPYPYEKLDQVAVPTVMFGAMENPGLVTYQQTLLLAKPEEETIRHRRGYAGTCAHELAHQWFGNLVTLAWWDDTWLNEAFASWMGGKILDQWKPEWESRISQVSSRSFAMDQDSLVAARKIRQPIESKGDIANAFDSITYTKGAAVIRMFESWVGTERFQKGVQRYLTQHAWGAATARDFLEAVDLAPAFSTFLDQAGAPLVTAELKCDASGARVALSQKRFLQLGSTGSARQTWQVPVCVRYGAGASSDRSCTLLTAPQAELPLPSCPEWILANAGASGYYRTAYGGDLLQRLLADGGRRLTVAERVGVLGDVRALVKSGELSAAEALALVPEFSRDPSRHVVAAAAGIVTSVRPDLIPDELRANYTRFLRRTFGDRARDLGWKARPGEDDDTRLLRREIVPLVADQAEDPELAAEARTLAARWLGDRRAVDPNMVDAVLRVAARRGDRALFDRFHAAARQATERRQRSRLLGAMAAFRDPDIVRSSLALLLTDQFDARESMGLLFGPAGYSKTRSLAYDFVRENYDALAARLPRALGGDAAADLPGVASGFCDPDRKAEVESFFRDRTAKATGGARRLAQVVEQISLCIALRSAQEAGVAGFLQQY